MAQDMRENPQQTCLCRARSDGYNITSLFISRMIVPTLLSAVVYDHGAKCDTVELYCHEVGAVIETGHHLQTESWSLSCCKVNTP